MATRIYYFTGTGNSLWAARVLADALGDASLTPIVRALGDGDTAPDEDRVVIVAPVYMYRLPHVVMRFLDRLRTSAPVSVVATMGGDAGDLFAVLRRHLARRSMTLAVGVAVAVQTNYIAWGGAPDDDVVAERIEAARDRLLEVASLIRAGETRVDAAHSRWRALVHPGLLYRLGYQVIPRTDRDFHVDEGCDGCGVCALVCPVDNVALVDDRPGWNARCEQCLACLQWCPQQAIQVKDKTRDERRYHHPEVRAKDIAAQKRRPRRERGRATDP